MRHYAPGGGHSTDGSASTQNGERRGRRFFACHSCGGPHPWMEFKNEELIVIHPNRNNPGVGKNAKKNIDRIKANHQKIFRQNTKRKNLGTANFAKFDSAGQDCIREQVCCKPSDQPRDAARREECSGLDEKSLTTFCCCDGRAKGFAREHQNGFL